jgi:hypothetical protein
MKIKYTQTVALLTVFALVISAFSFIFVSKASAAGITTMSVTGTGITANSSSITTAITPTVHYTTTTALTAAGNTIQITLNGMTVVSGQTLTVANLTLTGCTTSNTLEAAPGTADNGSHAVTITNGASGNSNPVILITLDSNTGVQPNCTATAYTLAVASGKLQSSSTAANYAISIQTTSDSGSFFYYVGNENQVQVTATVDNVLSFTIRNSADTADQVNVGASTVGPNLCDLGNLSNAGVQTCAYRLKVATNAVNGYYVQVVVDGGLRKTGHTITNTPSGSSVTAGTEGYNIVFNSGAATAGSVSTCDGVITTGGCLADGIAWNNSTSTVFNNTTTSTMYSVNGPNNPGAVDTVNTALVTTRGESDASTPAGTYSEFATYTVTSRW